MFEFLLAASLVFGSGCVCNDCSDDVDGVLGNEELAWDASEGATYYEIAIHGETCAKVINSTSYLVSGTPCDEINDGSGFVVRACNDAGCSDWSTESVEILPHSCLDGEHNCEKPCYDWLPQTDWQRLKENYDPCL